MPVFASTLRIAGAGPKPMITGSTPTYDQPRTYASGFLPSFWAFAAVVTTIAAAPSTIPDALPAVTMDSGPNAGGSAASRSSDVPGKRWSSLSTCVVFLPCFTSTDTRSCAKRPLLLAAFARSCERSANSSCCWREMP